MAKPSSSAIDLATSYSAISRPEGLQRGRRTPVSRCSFRRGYVGLEGGEPCRGFREGGLGLGHVEISNEADDATQLTHCPPRTTPQLSVLSSCDMASMAMICWAISRIADRPSPGRAPAWLGRPVAVSL